MAKSYKTDSKSNELQQGRQPQGDHLFVADGLTMQKYALPSFDSESLKYWIGQSNIDAFKPNPLWVVDPDSEVETLIDDAIFNTILAYNDGEDGTGTNLDPSNGFINITAWRTKGRNGEYKFYEKFSDWEFEDTYGQIDPAQVGRIWTADELDLLNIPITGDASYAADDRANGPQTFLEFIIQMNVHINSLLQQDVTGEDNNVWNITDKLRREFLVDVQSSKQGCINWTAKLKYKTQTIERSEEGQLKSSANSGKVETTGFRLYLFTPTNPILPSRKVTLKNLDLVGKRSHFDTGEFLQSEDGKVYRVPDVHSPRSEVAGELSVTYTDFLGKWESGSPQMIAVLTTNIPAAKGVEIADLESDSVPSLLDYTNGQEIVFGSAIPLHMQNSNPRQWSPMYDNYEETRRSDDFVKSQVKVGNLFPINFNRGQMVLLNRIEGVWFPIPFAEGVAEPEVIENRDPKWEFMYLMTNQEFHFKDKNFEDTSPDDFEKGFYIRYYADDIFEENVTRYDSGRFLGKEDHYNEFFQVTSWDFMGDAIGGTRTKRTAGRLEDNYYFRGNKQTQNAELVYIPAQPYEKGVNGNAISNTEYFRNVEDKDYDDEVRNTYPFFGCTFPDGYNISNFKDRLATNETAEGDYFGTILPRYKFEEYPHFFPVSGNVLQNNNDVTQIGSSDTHQELGMFADIDQTQLKHLPADIATHASPSGKWGYPITSARIFDITDNDKNPGRDFSTGSPPTATLSGDIHQFLFESGAKRGAQNRYGWVYSRPYDRLGESGVTSEEMAKSAYDLQPVRFTRIQFRPLTKELYSFLERSNIGTTNPGSNKYYDGFQYMFDPPPTEEGGMGPSYAAENSNYADRGGDSERLWQGCGYYSPVSELAARMNLKRLNEPTDVSEFGFNEDDDGNAIRPGLVGTFGLKYGSDLSKFAEDELERNKDNGYPYRWWTYRWMDGLNGAGDQSAGGIGIIGATMSVRSVGTLSIATENVHLEDFPIDGGGTQRSLNLGNFDEANTTDLFMRCYQHWPREQTIYDPRYFVVHHFNQGQGPYQQSFDIATAASGVIIKDFASELDQITQAGIDAKLVEEGLIAEGDTLPKGYAQPSGWFPIKKQLNNVDIKAVTMWTGGLANLDTKIYGDATYGTGDIGLENKIRHKDDWWFNPTRRGKLLPYSYKYRTIGIKADNVVKINRGDIVITDEVDIVITSVGTGYSKDEEFTAVGGAGGGAIFKVTAIDELGGITGIESRSDNDYGLSYSPEDFRPEAILQDQEWFRNTIEYSDDVTVPAPVISKITLQPLTQGDKPPQGEGFVAYVVRGTVVFSPLLTDHKPAEALDVTGPIRLSAFSRDNLSSNASNQFQITTPDADNSYDLFFRYHNDISHVGFGSRSQALPNPRDQMITLTINNNIGLGAGTGDDINWSDPFTNFGAGGGTDDSFFDFNNNCTGDGFKSGGAKGDTISFGFDQC